MRLAIVSDIHDKQTAFEAVLADLQQTPPDLVLHAGDLADTGSSPAEIVDRIRSLGWQSVPIIHNKNNAMRNPDHPLRMTDL